MAHDEFTQHMRDLREYYSGDSFALASLAAVEADVARDVFHSNQAVVEAANRSIEHVHNVRQELLLAEIRIYTKLGSAETSLSHQREAVAAYKQALSLFPLRVPPLLGDMRRDRDWMQAVRSAYDEACRLLVSAGNKTDLEGVVLHPVTWHQLMKENPRMAEQTAPVDPMDADHTQRSIAWMKLLCGDADKIRRVSQSDNLYEGNLVEDAAVVRKAAEILRKLQDTEAKRIRTSLKMEKSALLGRQAMFKAIQKKQTGPPKNP